MIAHTPASGSQIDALLQRRAIDARARDGRTGHGGPDRGVPTLLCASGRGGSGTTLVSALLAMAAAGDGYRVLLIDADEHVGPLSLLLNARPRASWQDLRGGRVSPMDTATPLSTTLTLVAGGPARIHDTGLPFTAAEKKACLRRVSALAQGMDLVVIDCGSRFDSVAAAITPHADERLLAIAAGADPIGLAATYALCKAIRARHGALPLDLLVNRHEGSEAARCFDALDAGVRQFLGTSLRFAGAIPTDPTLDTALRAGMPFPDAAAGSPAAIAAHDAVVRVLAGTSSSRPGV
jgi:MinD-like ATPase involved in chromosome partitioning or flagellar assembly